MYDHVLTVANRGITHDAKDYIVQGGVGADTVTATFDDEWDGLVSATVTFEGSGEVIQQDVEIDGLTCTCEVPWECIQGKGALGVAFVGYLDDDGDRIVTRRMRDPIRIVPSGETGGTTGSESSTDKLSDAYEYASEALETAEAASTAASTAQDAADAAAEAAEAAQDTADVALHSASGYCESTSGYAKLGRNLATAFADEIGDEEPITWLHDRAAAGDFEGLAVGDYLTVTLNDSSSTTMAYQLAGFDLYYGVGDAANGHHVTMVPAIVYPEYVVWNEEATNQGTEDEPSPWLSSYLYSWMNTTFLAYLPEEWQAALVELRLLLPTRYSSSGSLTDDSGYEWASPGAVWAPSEREVWGDVRRGTMDTSIPSTDRQLPIFQRSTVVRSRGNWWERSAASASSSNACHVGHYGGAPATSAANTAVRPLPCFHVG